MLSTLSEETDEGDEVPGNIASLDVTSDVTSDVVSAEVSCEVPCGVGKSEFISATFARH